MKIKYIYIIVLILAGGSAYGQLYPERPLIRRGNKAYESENYAGSEILYRHALEKAPESYEAYGNLANSLYKQEQYEEAEKIYSRLLADTANTEYTPSTLYNQGNAYFRQRKLEEAIESYKSSLRINPSDTEAKFNLAYARKLLSEQQEGGSGDQNQDQNQERQQNEQDQDNNESRQDNQQQQSAMDPRQAEQMLQAVQQAEDRTRDKMNEQQAQVGTRSGKNW